MIKLHHLNNSRSQRLLWCLEELSVDYEIEQHTRVETSNLAPESLKAVHLLGKAPVLQDGDVTIAESGAALDYLTRTYADGAFTVPVGDPDYERFNEWMHYVEGSLMLPLLLNLYVGFLGEAGQPLYPRIGGEIALHVGYVAAGVADKQFLVGDRLTAADMHLGFPLETLHARGGLKHWPNLVRYLEGLQARPAYKRALEKGGAYDFGPKA